MRGVSFPGSSFLIYFVSWSKQANKYKGAFKSRNSPDKRKKKTLGFCPGKFSFLFCAYGLRSNKPYLR